MNKYSLIIPFYNEGKRLINLLNQLEGSRHFFKEIILVDDCSTGFDYSILTQNFSWFKLIKLDKNIGKSGAVVKGLEITTTENIVLMDADLKGVNNLDWNKIFIIYESRKLDMLIIAPHKDHTLDNYLFNIYRVLSGIRVIKKRKLVEVFKTEKPQRFQLEIAINKHMIEKNDSVEVFKSDLRNTIHFKKYGLVSALTKEMQMYYQIFNYSKISGFFRQVRYFSNLKDII